jgi:hypothetical protein
VPDTTARGKGPVRGDAGPGAGAGGGAELVVGPAVTAARYRVRRASARLRAVKVLYGEDELAAVTQAAVRVGLRPSSYVAAAALASAKGGAVLASGQETREVLTELLRTRAALGLYGSNLNQIAAALNSRATGVPVWLAAAVAGAERATARIDEATAQLYRRLA